APPGGAPAAAAGAGGGRLARGGPPPRRAADQPERLGLATGLLRLALLAWPALRVTTHVAGCSAAVPRYRAACPRIGAAAAAAAVRSRSSRTAAARDWSWRPAWVPARSWAP